ncbi:MAG: helix-turn-helix transcriptional regulator [Clostridia bacterium]|nr:helix-turn-helix transcriptional regulator [Clostridia bacterium]
MGKKVGKLIKEARTGADMTQEQLARKVKGVSASDISAAERGTKDLTQAQLKLIAKATGVTQASLLNAAKEEKGTSTGKTTKKTKTTKTTKTTTSKSTTTKAKTPSNANKTMKVTATEKKLIEAYRLADSDAKKRAMSVLKGEEIDVAGKVEDVIEDLVGNLLGR